MAWTWPTALFFGAVAAALMLFTVLDLTAPSQVRKGLLPIPTTRGDRLFLGMLGAAFVMAVWLGVTDRPASVGGALAALWFGAILRWG